MQMRRSWSSYLIGSAAILMPLVAAAQGAAFKNPLQFNKVDDLITSILNAIQLSVVTLAIVFIVIGGILYITSAGNESRMSLAKGALTAAVIGLAVVVAAPTFLLEIYKILGAQQTPEVVAQAPRIAIILKRTLEFLLGIAGTIALIAMVVGGMVYMTSGGDENRMNAGKRMFIGAVIGIAIIMASLVVVRKVAEFFTPNAGAPAAAGATAVPAAGGTGTFPTEAGAAQGAAGAP